MKTFYSVNVRSNYFTMLVGPIAIDNLMIETIDTSKWYGNDLFDFAM